MDIQEEIRKGKTIYDLSLRVTYYARVSTDHEEQSSSIINQSDYFSRYIQNYSNWIFIPGYVDEGISGKDVKRRESFLKNIRDIQVIITCTEKITLENLKYFSYNVIDGDIYEKN